MQTMQYQEAYSELRTMTGSDQEAKAALYVIARRLADTDTQFAKEYAEMKRQLMEGVLCGFSSDVCSEERKEDFLKRMSAQFWKEKGYREIHHS